MNGFYVSVIRGAEDERESAFYEEFHEAGLELGRFDGVGPLWDEMRATWERAFDVASSQDVQASFWKIDVSMVRGLSRLVVDEAGSRWSPTIGSISRSGWPPGRRLGPRRLPG